MSAFPYHNYTFVKNEKTGMSHVLYKGIGMHTALCGRVPHFDDKVGLHETFSRFKLNGTQTLKEVINWAVSIFNYTPEGAKGPKVCCHCRANMYRKLRKHTKAEYDITQEADLQEAEDSEIRMFFAYLAAAEADRVYGLDEEERAEGAVLPEEECLEDTHEELEEKYGDRPKLFRMNLQLTIVGRVSDYLKLDSVDDVLRKIYDNELWAEGLVTNLAQLTEGDKMPIPEHLREPTKVENTG